MKNGYNVADAVITSAKESIKTMGLPEAIALKVIASHKLRQAILANNVAEQFFTNAGVEAPETAKIDKALTALSNAQLAIKDLGIKAPKLPEQTISILTGYRDAQEVFKREKFSPQAVPEKARPAFVCAVQVLEGGVN